MARVISYYTATTNKRSYFRASPSFSASGIDQFESGTNITIYTNSSGNGPVMQNSFYQVRSGMEVSGPGWVYSGDVSVPVPYYTTTTDACSPPSSVTLNVETKVLTISGGSGGDLNMFVGWGISWRQRPDNSMTWGAWSNDVVTQINTVSVSAPAGYVREFRVRTLGSAGEQFYSNYVVCPTVLYGVSSCTAPTNIIASNSFPAPGTDVTLTWQGAGAGESNPITGYEIYESFTSEGPYTLKASVATDETYGTYQFTSDLYLDDTLFLRIKTIGSKTGYDSPLSEAVVTLTGGYGYVTAPTNITISSEATYPQGIVRLDWSGATEAYLNSVGGYAVYRAANPNGTYTLVESVFGETSAFVYAPVKEGIVYYFKVKSLGSVPGYDSNLSSVFVSLKVAPDRLLTGVLGRTNAQINIPNNAVEWLDIPIAVTIDGNGNVTVSSDDPTLFVFNDGKGNVIIRSDNKNWFAYTGDVEGLVTLGDSPT